MPPIETTPRGANGFSVAIAESLGSTPRAALHSAIALYLSDVNGASITSTETCTAALSSPPTNFTCGSISTSTVVTGTGWAPIDFTDISSGSPLARLPLDPVNDTTYAYTFQGGSLNTFEIDANMESTKYASGGGGDVESNNKDGGNDDTYYEIGNDPGLDL
ncbi:MAG: hypothetical protein UX22_C0013G0001 [Candidatus Jorgensenbacteria bacterium GW2011_GWA2_45_9]|uniref:Uncharacterized protein n=1 Tax=Candidatus Jorgensenbacteria bacterium GW2011_GWA2_45_9 TaxID=1618663 RepID=A0A0G1R256_9BACT|nr:MAG: hypothetical protein UX22_C0013G0001 [Candidatus Jorgensenbacteria bacterium GW2011_GWA2_45_9]